MSMANLHRLTMPYTPDAPSPQAAGEPLFMIPNSYTRHSATCCRVNLRPATTASNSWGDFPDCLVPGAHHSRIYNIQTIGEIDCTIVPVDEDRRHIPAGSVRTYP